MIMDGAMPASPVKQLYEEKLQHHFPHSSAVKTEITINPIQSFLNKRFEFVFIISQSRISVHVVLLWNLIWTAAAENGNAQFLPLSLMQNMSLIC